MKKSLLALSLVATLASAFTIEEISGFNHPESVFVDSKNVYVSNVGKNLAPLEKDKDGFISKLDKNGKILDKYFIKNLNAPKGMSEVKDNLYVVDIDTLYGFNLKNKKEIFKLNIKNSVFLNDIARLDDNTLLVSDTGTGIIYQVDLQNKKYSEFIKLDMNTYGGPNGLLIDEKNNALLVVGYDKGVVFSIDLATKNINTLYDKKEAYDGIVSYNDELLVSSWGENFKGNVYSLKNGKAKRLELDYIKGPADMFLDKNILWIPKMAEGKILKIIF